MDYKDFTAADFLADGYFREWVLSPNEANSQCWVQWMAAHPQQQDEIDLARNLLGALQQSLQVLPPGKASRIRAAIEAAIEAPAENLLPTKTETEKPA